MAVVADGMGGHNAGEVASGIAVACLQRQLGTKTPEQITPEQVREALQQANEYVMQKALSSESAFFYNRINGKGVASDTEEE